MSIFDFNVGDKVTLNAKIHSQDLVKLYRFVKNNCQNYLYVHSIDYSKQLIECSDNEIIGTGIFAKPEELITVEGECEKQFYLPKQRQEFELGTRVHLLELNIFNTIYLTTIGSTRIFVSREDEESFIDGNNFSTYSLTTDFNMTTHKKINLKEVEKRLKREDVYKLQQFLRNEKIINEGEFLEF